MLERWYALDAGSYSIKLYDFAHQKEAEVRSFLALEQGKAVACGNKALEYLYGDQRKIQVRSILDAGMVLHDFSSLIQEGLDQLNAHRLFRPCFLAVLPEEVQDSHPFQNSLIMAGAKKMELVTVMDVLAMEGTCFLIHAGHSYTDMAIYVGKERAAHKMIHFAGAKMDEEIVKWVAKKTRCLITSADACRLKEEASSLFWRKQDQKLTCMAMNRYQQYERIEIMAHELWPAMKIVIDQIVLWAKALLDTLPVQQKAEVLKTGLDLSGGLAGCFGLRQSLRQSLTISVLCTKEPKYDMIDALKEWR